MKIREGFIRGYLAAADDAGADVPTPDAIRAAFIQEFPLEAATVLSAFRPDELNWISPEPSRD